MAGALGSGKAHQWWLPYCGCCCCYCGLCAGSWLKFWGHGPAWSRRGAIQGFADRSSLAPLPSGCPWNRRRLGVWGLWSQGHRTHLGSRHWGVGHSPHQTCLSPGHRYGSGRARAECGASPSPPSPSAPEWMP